MSTEDGKKMKKNNPLEICLSGTTENYSGILRIRLADAKAQHLPRFQTQLYTSGTFDNNTEILAEFAKFVNVAFSEMEISEQLGQQNRRLTFDMSVEIVHPASLTTFEDWFNSEIRNKPIALEVTTNNLQEYVFAPVNVVFRYIAPANEGEGTRFALDFAMSKREVVNQSQKKQLISDVSFDGTFATVHLRAGLTVANHRFGFGTSRSPKNATWFATPEFEVNSGKYYIFAESLIDSCFDYAIETFKLPDAGTYRMSGRFIVPEVIGTYRMSGRFIEPVIGTTAVYRMSGRFVTDTVVVTDPGGRIGTVPKDAYAFPRLGQGVTYIDVAGNTSVPRLNLDITVSGSDTFIKDLAFAHNFSHEIQEWQNIAVEQGVLRRVGTNFYYSKQALTAPQDYNNAAQWERVTVTKQYTIGFARTDRPSTYFTAAQMQSGINVNAWHGREIVVLAAYIIDQYPFFIGTYKHQQIYIPNPAGHQATQQLHGGTYYHQPIGKSYGQTYNTVRFFEYLTMPKKPADHIVGIQTMAKAERLSGDQYAKSGVLSKYASKGEDSSIFRGEDWLYSIGHPLSYHHTQAEWTAWWNSKVTGAGRSQSVFFPEVLAAFNAHFTNSVNPRNNVQIKLHKYVLYNNESWRYWNEDFKSMVRQCIEFYNANAPASKFSAWTACAIKASRNYSNWQNAYTDYMQPNLAALQANKSYFELAATNSYEWACKIQHIGQYINSPYDGTMYLLIAEAMMISKFLDSSYSPVATTFRLVEALTSSMQLSQQFWRHKGVTYISFEKPIVSPHVAHATGSLAATYAKGLDGWDDGISYEDDADATYPPLLYRLADGQYLTMNGDPAHNINPVNNCDSFAEGAAMVYESAEFLSVPQQLADVFHDGRWRTGAEVFPIGAMITGTPCVTYRKLNNRILISAYDAYTKTIRDIQVRIENQIYTVRLFGDNPVPFVRPI